MNPDISYSFSINAKKHQWKRYFNRQQLARKKRDLEDAACKKLRKKDSACPSRTDLHGATDGCSSGSPLTLLRPGFSSVK